MMAVGLAEATLRDHLAGGLDIAAVNAPQLCTVSGPEEALSALAAKLSGAGVEVQRLPITCAAHSRWLEPVLPEFRDFLRSIEIAAPQKKLISNLTGKPLTAAEARDPDYWLRHLRHCVRFTNGLATLMPAEGRVFVEMGPGRALSSLARLNGVPPGRIIPALRHPDQTIGDDLWHVTTLARLWASGVAVDWRQIWGEEPRPRLPLPTYPFQRKTCFIAPAALEAAAATALAVPRPMPDITDWGWEQVWKPAAAGFDIADLAEVAPEDWLIFMDDAGLCAAISRRLQAAGHRVIPVHAADTFARRGEGYAINPAAGAEGHELLFRDLTARGIAPRRILHAWLFTQDERFRPGSSFAERNMEAGFWSLFHLLRGMAAEGAEARLLCVSNGALQLREEPLPWPEKALALGPIRVGAAEFPACRLSLLDLSVRGEIEAMAEAVLEEALSDTGPVALWRRGRRHEPVLRRRPLPAAAPLPEGAHVLITGGSGGIARTLARDLIRRYRARVTLVSRSGAGLAIEGGELLALRADVTHLTEMEQARDTALARFGPIHMVIHAAGMLEDAPILSKTPSQIEQVLEAKLHGTKVLEQVFPDGSIKELVLFSSTSTLIGAAGQVDYLAANAYLNAWARARRGGRTRVLALNWGLWQGVGMAARARAGATRPTGQPLLAERGEGEAGEILFHGRCRSSDWLLDGHRTAAGRALMPGTGLAEMLAEAATVLHPGEGCRLRELTFLHPLDLEEGEERGFRLRARPTSAGHAVEVQSLIPGTGWLTHATGEIQRASPLPGRMDAASLSAPLSEGERGEGLPLPQEAHLRFGPRWRALQSRHIAQGEGVARLTLPAPFAAEAGSWRLHPALLDAATGWAMELAPAYSRDHLWVPMSLRALVLHRALPARIISHVRHVEAGEGMAGFDVTLADESGAICVEVEGLLMRRLAHGLVLPAPLPPSLEPERAEGSGPLAPLLRHGIRPEDGAEAFHRARAVAGAEIHVSSLDLPGMIGWTQAQRPPQPVGGHERPDLRTPYVAPRSEVERRLARMWEELLGLEKVGVEDSFFDLGGHSLIAVRLFVMVKKAFGAEFPISVLFEAPTIAAIARRIEARGEGRGKGGRPPAAAGFTHVVAMEPGPGEPGPMKPASGGGAPPLFIVAGMFGNVLNLRPLARLIGRERAVYGLQARGLSGEARPHEDFSEAARDYIAEMRQVQPEGPYLVAGFSGGGLVAWEIARQLEAAGEAVPCLLLLDTPLPQRPPLAPADRARIKLAEFRRKGPAYLREWIAARRAWRQARARPPADEGEARAARQEAAFRAALGRFRLSRREGETVLFRPPLDRRWKVGAGRYVSSAREYVLADNGLAAFAPRLRVVEVPGDHDSMVLEPNVRVLAARLQAELAGAVAAAGAGAADAAAPGAPRPLAAE